jgi:DHA2 family multidrug resistance protein
VHFGHHAVNLRPLIGLGGVLVAAMNAEFNELNMASALVDMCGAFGITRAPGG